MTSQSGYTQYMTHLKVNPCLHSSVATLSFSFVLKLSIVALSTYVEGEKNKGVECVCVWWWGGTLAFDMNISFLSL